MSGRRASCGALHATCGAWQPTRVHDTQADHRCVSVGGCVRMNEAGSWLIARVPRAISTSVSLPCVSRMLSNACVHHIMTHTPHFYASQAGGVGVILHAWASAELDRDNVRNARVVLAEALRKCPLVGCCCSAVLKHVCVCVSVSVFARFMLQHTASAWHL